MKDLKKVLDELLENKLNTKLKEQREMMIQDISAEFRQTIDKVKVHENRLDEIDNYSRINNVVVYGIPMTENEAPLEVTEKIGSVLGVPLPRVQVDIAHRLRSRNTNMPPPFIIKLLNRWKKEELMTAAKAIKPTAASFGGSNEVRIFVNEQLSPKNQLLFHHAKKLKKEYFVWGKNGVLWCRKRTEGAQPIRITDMDDIDYLEESKEANLNGVFYSQSQKRPRDGGSSTEMSPEGANPRYVKKAWRQTDLTGNGRQASRN